MPHPEGQESEGVWSPQLKPPWALYSPPPLRTWGSGVCRAGLSPHPDSSGSDAEHRVRVPRASSEGGGQGPRVEKQPGKCEILHFLQGLSGGEDPCLRKAFVYSDHPPVLKSPGTLSHNVVFSSQQQYLFAHLLHYLEAERDGRVAPVVKSKSFALTED